jgi:hypothetical protein
MSKLFDGLSGSTVSGFIDADDDVIPVYDPPDATAVRIANANVNRTVPAKGEFNHTVRLVCKACNNGWLADLEGTTEPVLTPMIGAQPQLLTDDTATTLATWVLKTVLVANVAFDIATLPSTPLHDLYADRRASDRTVVWCAYRPDFGIGLRSNPQQSFASLGSGENDGVHATMHIGHVLLGVRVRFGPYDPRPLIVPYRIHEQRIIWPPTEWRDRSWPPPRPLSDQYLRMWIDPPSAGHSARPR